MRLLIETLEAVPEVAFNMRDWAKETECGTVACAVGWYAFKHPEEGLCLFRWYSSMGIWGLAQGNGCLPTHFGITDYEADYLFFADQYSSPITKSIVLGRILKFYEEHKIDDPRAGAEAEPLPASHNPDTAPALFTTPR